MSLCGKCRFFRKDWFRNHYCVAPRKGETRSYKRKLKKLKWYCLDMQPKEEKGLQQAKFILQHRETQNIERDTQRGGDSCLPLRVLVSGAWDRGMELMF